MGGGMRGLPAGFVLDSGRLPTGFEVDLADGGFSVGDMVSNIPSSAKKYAGDMVSAIVHPMETAESLSGLVEGLGNKIGRKVAESVHGQELEPMEGRSEAIPDAVGQMIADRYGSMDALQDTLESDPVGLVGDLSALLMGGGAVVPKAASIGKSIEPIAAAANVAKKVGAKIVPQKAVNSLYQSAAKFSTVGGSVKRNAMIKTALDEGVQPTQRGMDTLQTRIGSLNETIDGLIGAAGTDGRMIPVKNILMRLDELKASRDFPSVSGVDDVKALNKVDEKFRKSLKGATHITPAQAQKLKVDTYNKINFDAQRLSGKMMREEGRKSLARGAKEELESVIPNIGDINKDLGGLYQVQPDLSRAAARIENRNMIGLPQIGTVGAGTAFDVATGVPGAGIAGGFILAMLQEPHIASKIAIGIHKVKNGDTGWLNGNLTNAQRNAVMVLSGRSDEELRDMGFNF